MEETSSVGGLEGEITVGERGVAAEQCSRAREKRARAFLVESRREWERAVARHL